MSNYYDIDDFLAQEELIPTKTLFEYWKLGSLDKNSHKANLPKHTTLKLPVWVIQKWAGLGFCQLSLPKAYQLTETSLLHSLKFSFFESAMAVIRLAEESSHSTYNALRNHPNSNSRRLQFQHLEQLLQSVKVLRNKLVSSYAADRLPQTLNHCLSSSSSLNMSDNNTFLHRLTNMEQKLFHKGSRAAKQQQHDWKPPHKRQRVR